MRHHNVATLAALVVLAGLAAPLSAQEQSATVRESVREFPTYPFSDPNPIPNVGRIYPYFRFDGFSATSRPRV